MKLLIFAVVIIISTNVLSGQTIIDSVYTGLQEMCWIDSSGLKDCYIDESKPNWKWYHLTTIEFSGDSVFVEQSPIKIYQNDTLYSASDGGFYYYSGTIKRINDSKMTLSLTETRCDYCAILKKKQDDGTFVIVKRTKLFNTTVNENGLMINEQLFKKIDKWK